MALGDWRPRLHYKDPVSLLFHFSRLFSECLAWMDTDQSNLMPPTIGEMVGVISWIRLLDEPEIDKAVKKFTTMWNEYGYKKKNWDQKAFEELSMAGWEVARELEKLVKRKEKEREKKIGGELESRLELDTSGTSANPSPYIQLSLDFTAKEEG